MVSTKTDKVIEHLIVHGEISTWEAIRKYGATRLSAIIFNLKKKGYTFETEIKKTKDRFGNTVEYANYKLNSTNGAPKEKNSKKGLFTSALNKVKVFHEKFEVKNNETPENLEFDEVMLRCKLLKEELDEYEEAAVTGDKVEIADALGDQLYIVLGTILRHGMQDVISDVFKEIHRSNMSKLDKDGKPIINGVNGSDPRKPLGKILKSELYSEPDIKKILEPWL